MTQQESYDLLVIGGGINGAGVARDAAGRGLSVCLCEQDDLAGHTSSVSTKLIHGGLRYLEHYDFRLVRHALRERRRLLDIAPHIVHPLRFVLPHHAALRPRWLIRLGLFLYDRLAGPDNLPGSRGVDLTRHPAGRMLRSDYSRGFEYSDCQVQDARLVVLNAMDARERGASIYTRTRCVRLHRHRRYWEATLEDRRDGLMKQVRARVVINAAGPWVESVLSLGAIQPGPCRVRYVKGSHVVVPRLFSHDYAYIFQHVDGRILFAIPFEQDYTLLGTTEVELQHLPDRIEISPQETSYICDAISGYLRKPVRPEDVVWSFSGIRPLFDDGLSDASRVTRDYHLHLDRDQAPILSIYGGKITTYRKLAEMVLALLDGVIPDLGQPWTGSAHLPGGDLPKGDYDAFLAACLDRFPGFPESLIRNYAGRYGSRIERLLEGCGQVGELGRDFGNQLYEREVRYLVEQEFAETAEDIVWRRTRCGLGLDARALDSLRQWLTGLQGK